MIVNFFIILMVTAVYSSMDMIPDCLRAEMECPNQNVKFYLYTRATSENPVLVDTTEDIEMLRNKFIVGRPLLILIHGYTGHKDFSPNTELRPAFFQNNDYNIISVDYGLLAKEGCYLTAVRNIRVVSNCTAQLIDHFILNSIFTFDQIHVIGFSLGGQLSGQIATFLQTGKLKRITGLDPAKPMFITAAKQFKIDKDDAEFVQIIHTDVLGRGVLIPSGHVDFYANGGYEQPGCQNINLIDAGSCNHARAPAYYAESINSDTGFWGYGCAHWYLYVLGVCQYNEMDQAIMGDKTPSETRGLYFLTTKDNSPHAKGKNSNNEVVNSLDDSQINYD